MRILLAAVLALVACSKSSNDKPKDKPAATADKAGSDDKAAPKPAADLFPGPKVSLPTPVAKLALDMPEAEAKAAAPDLFAAKYGYEPQKGVEINAQIEKGRLYQIYVEIDEPYETVRGWLDKKWFPPRETKNSIGNPVVYYDSPDVGLRATLEKSASNSMLRYYRVVSLEQLLGKDGKQWGFETTPLIGMTQDELMKTYAAYHPTPRDDDPGSIMLAFPPLTTSEYGSHASVRVKDGKVTGYTLSISTGGDAAADAAVVARIEQMFGAGKPEGTLYVNYPGPPKAKAEIRKDSASFAHTIWVGDYKK